MKIKKKKYFKNERSNNNHFIEFKNVSFCYEKKNKILDNLSFFIDRGEKIAVVGPTGSGKTTIFRLLYKFYENFSEIFLLMEKKLEIFLNRISQTFLE